MLDIECLLRHLLLIMYRYCFWTSRIEKSQFEFFLRFYVENRLPIRHTKFEVDYTQIEYHLWLSLDYEERNKICNWFWFAHFSFTGLVPPSGWWFQMQTHSRHNLNEIQSNAFHFEWGKRWKALILQFKCHLKFHFGGWERVTLWGKPINVQNNGVLKKFICQRLGTRFFRHWLGEVTSDQMVFINLYNFLKASKSMIYRF